MSALVAIEAYLARQPFVTLGFGATNFFLRFASSAFESFTEIFFAGMSIEIMALYLFQSASGALYWHLGILLASFMFGLAVGSFPNPFTQKQNQRRRLLIAAGLLTLLSLGVSFHVDQLLTISHPLILFTALLFLTGFLVGTAFVAAALSVPEKTGILYAADLWGSALGALATGTFLVPIIGFKNSSLLIAAGLFLAISLFIGARSLQTRRS